MSRKEKENGYGSSIIETEVFLMRIENELIALEVQERGGSMTSLFDKRRNVELLYQPKPDSWQGQDVFIFPFIARLVDQTYTYQGKTYSLKNHGLLRYMDCHMEKKAEDSLQVSFHSTEETKAQYPFDFEAYLTYSLKGNEVILSYRIVNLSKEPMPFMLGAHPAFALPGERKENEFDISGNRIIIEDTPSVNALLQEETFSFMTGKKERMDSLIPLSKDLFRKINTIILEAEGFQDVRLEKKDGSSIVVHKEDAPYLALWSDMKFGDYVCIEPWHGIPDTLGVSKELSEKPGIHTLSVGCEFDCGYRIEIL